jgi:predicted ATPase
MKESIHIKNLGPIADIHIEDIKPFTVFIGESGSGKSTLMKAIALFRWIYKMHNIRSYLKHSNISESLFEFQMDEYVKNCGFEDYITENTEIIYKTSLTSGEKYNLRFTKNLLKGTSNNELIKGDDIYFNKISFIAETRNVIPLWADKGARQPGAELGFYFQEVFNDFDSATEDISEMPMDFLGIKFLVEKTNQGKKYFIKPIIQKDFHIEFKNSSSGTQTSVPISLLSMYFSEYFNFEDAFNRSAFLGLLKSNKLTDFKAIKDLSELNKKIYIHIEEPELSLYPDAQCSLINDMIKKCLIESKRNINIVFSTHSPYIINHLNLLIKAGDKNQLIEGAKLNFDDLAVFEVGDGRIQDLKTKNKRLVYTNPLSDTMNTIYHKYKQLDEA